MELVIGPVLALLISLGYTNQSSKRAARELESLRVKIEKINSRTELTESRTELIESRLDKSDTELLQKVMTTMMPLAKAVNKLNNEVGI